MTKILAHCDFSMRFPVLMLQGKFTPFTISIDPDD